MNGLLLYLLKASIAQTLLFLFYWFVLRKDTYFLANRFFLLFALFLPFLVAVPHEIGKNVFTGTAFPIHLPSMDGWNDSPGEKVIPASFLSRLSIRIILEYLYFLVVFFLFVRLGLALYRIVALIRKSTMIRKDKLRLISVEQTVQAFSFFRWVFVPFGNTETHPAIDHEKVHADQWHTFDIVVAEVVSVVLWFNPFVFFHKQAIRSNHEFLADRKVIQGGLDFETYLSALLDAVTLSQFRGFASHFSQNLTKKRILMMTKIKSNKLAWIKFILIIPVVFVIVAGFSHPAPDLILKVLPMAPAMQSNAQDMPSIAPYRLGDKSAITHVSSFGLRVHPINHQQNFHQGVDFGMPGGLDVLATANGTALLSHRSKEWGKAVILKHSEGYVTVYAHLSEVLVKPGEQVKQGQVIGKVGSTGTSVGTHIHYEVLLNDKNLDPLKFIPKSALPVTESRE